MLTKVLLLHDFGLNINLPPNRLCPPIPNRINYLCWLSELLEFNISHPNITKDQLNSIPILDIGVGASCIYPLLGQKMFGWNFYGSDIDQESLEWANNQILANDLGASIRLSYVSSSRRLQLALKDFITTNSNEANLNSTSKSNFIQRIFQV